MLMTTPSEATSVRLRRRRRRSFGIRAFEVAVILTIGAVTAVLVATKADELPGRSNSAGCTISQLAAERAALAYLAGDGAGDWPKDLVALTSGDHPVLDLPRGVSLTGAKSVSGPDWTLTMHGGGAAQPTFTCG
jgi:hypothetical protein